MGFLIGFFLNNISIKKKSIEKIQREIHPLSGGWFSEKFTGPAGGPQQKFTGPAGEGQQKKTRALPGRASKKFTGPAGEGQQTIHGPRQGGPKKHFTGPAGEGPKQSTGQAPQKLYADTGQNKKIGNATLKRKNIKVETKIPSGDHPQRHIHIHAYTRTRAHTRPHVARNFGPSWAPKSPHVGYKIDVGRPAPHPPIDSSTPGGGGVLAGSFRGPVPDGLLIL